MILLTDRLDQSDRLNRRTAMKTNFTFTIADGTYVRHAFLVKKKAITSGLG